MSEKMPNPNESPPSGSETELKQAITEVMRLRTHEKKGAPIERRTNLFKTLIEDGSFARWKAEGIPVEFKLDSEGLRITAGTALHTHIPYDKFSLEDAALIRNENLMVIDHFSDEYWEQQMQQWRDDHRRERDEAFEYIQNSGEFDAEYVEKIRKQKEKLDREDEEYSEKSKKRDPQIGARRKKRREKEDFLDQQEFEARVAEANGNNDVLEKINDNQDFELGNAVFNQEPRNFDNNLEPRDDRQAILLNGLCHELRMPSLIRHGHYHIPKRTLKKFIHPPVERSKDLGRVELYQEQSLADRILYLARFAEELNQSGDEVDHIHHTYRVAGRWHELPVKDKHTEFDLLFKLPLNEQKKEKKWHEGRWNDLFKTHDLARANKAVFDARKKDIGQRSNYEMAKIIETLFSECETEELQNSGIQMVRGLYSDGAEFVAFWDDEKYQRVLIDPKKYIRDTSAQKKYADIPSIPRADFEAFEAVILPFQMYISLSFSLHFDLKYHFEHVGAQWFTEEKSLEEKQEIQDAMTGMLRIAITELPRHEYNTLHAAFSPLLDSLSEEVWTKSACDIASKVNLDVKERYAASMKKRSARQILDEHVPMPKLKTVSLDAGFIEGMPDMIRNEPGVRFDPQLSSQEVTIKVVESGGPEALHFAKEGQALRALKIERRPTIVVTGAAASLDRDGSQAEQVAESVLKVAIETRANVVVPGTQAGLGIILARRYQEYLATLSEEQIKDAPHFLAIEPGKELYYPGNELLDTTPGNDLFALTAVDAIVTPYHAGWSQDKRSKQEYTSHVNYRQVLVTRMTGGQPSVVVSCSGGSWTIMENNVALRDGMKVIPLADTGRFSGLAEGVLRYSEFTGEESKEEIIEIIQHVVSQNVNEADRTKIAKELENPVYRSELITFLRQAKSGNVEPNTVSGLEDHLRSILIPKDDTVEA